MPSCLVLGRDDRNASSVDWSGLVPRWRPVGMVGVCCGGEWRGQVACVGKLQGPGACLSTATSTPGVGMGSGVRVLGAAEGAHLFLHLHFGGFEGCRSGRLGDAGGDNWGAWKGCSGGRRGSSRAGNLSALLLPGGDACLSILASAPGVSLLEGPGNAGPFARLPCCPSWVRRQERGSPFCVDSFCHRRGGLWPFAFCTGNRSEAAQAGLVGSHGVSSALLSSWNPPGEEQGDVGRLGGGWGSWAVCCLIPMQCPPALWW